MERALISYMRQNPDATWAEAVQAVAKTGAAFWDRPPSRRRPPKPSLKDQPQADGTPGSAVNRFKGDVSEYLVTADLMRRGFQVFKALSSTAPFDLVALAGDALYRVECKSGRRRPDGTIQHTGCGDPSRYDILAIALEDGACVYECREGLDL